AWRTPPKPPRPRPAPLAVSGALTRLEHELERAGGAGTPAGAALVREFWDGPGARSPLVEPVAGHPAERLVTFLWRDAEAERVLLFVNRITDERDLTASYLRRVAGTDVWHLTYRMASDWRASYSFLPQYGVRPAWLDSDDQAEIRAALDRGLADPRNPETVRNRSGTVMSVVGLPDAPRQRWVARRASVPRGVVTERSAPGGRRVWVYEPSSSVVSASPHLADPASPSADAAFRSADRTSPSVDPTSPFVDAAPSSVVPAPSVIPAQAGIFGPTPVVIVLDGEVWTSTQDLATTMDNLIHDRAVRPTRVIMLDSGGTQVRWDELGEPREFGRYLARRLLPWARVEYPISGRRRDVVLAGLSLGGLVALRTALEHPSQIGAVLSQSASLWNDDLSASLATSDVRGLRAYLEVGGQEWVLAEPNRRFASRLAQAGAGVRFVEYNGGHDYACWRGGIADGLRHLLPPTPAENT
ncbi:MAG: DUF3327 domain-containing protein, partial [Propionibacteriaceae bacterium]|nr:DUF3327 domain-containing protein [Propionibacteriaceae bacterium]